MSDKNINEGDFVHEKLNSLLEPIVAGQGYELYDLEYVKEGTERILRLYIDKPVGIDIDDCERVSHAVEAVLDEHDPIPGEYRLQVSSPGVERKIKKPSHFERFIGHRVTLRLFAPADPVTGRKKYTGTITNFMNNTISLTPDEGDEEISFDIKQVSACNLKVFD